MDQSRRAVPTREATRRSDTYRAELLPETNAGELIAFARQIDPTYPAVLDPQFFIASVASSWIPRLVLVRRGLEPVGLVYAREKALVGVPTGVMYADGTLGNLLLAHPDDQEMVLSASLQKLLGLPRFRAFRLLLPPAGHEERTTRNVAVSMNLHFSQAQDVLNHSLLDLPTTYEAFLTSLGSRTRRNFRYYRRRFEGAGYHYVEDLSQTEMCNVAAYLRTRCSIKSSTSSVDRICSWVGAADRPFACGLRSSEGNWLSVATGFYSGTRATMLLQINDDLHSERSSLSLVLRAYFIDSLIQKSFEKLVFWAGVGGPLARYVSFVPGTMVYIDSPSTGWKIARGLIGLMAPGLPKRMRRDLEWIGPPNWKSEDGAGSKL